MPMNISYINMCKLKKNRERRNELERERERGGWRLVVMVCVVVHLVYHLNLFIYSNTCYIYLEQIIIINVWRKSVIDIYFTELGSALTTVLPVLFKYCHKYCYSDSRNLWVVLKGGGLGLLNLIQPTISVPSQGHYGFDSFPVVDWFCLFIYLWVLTFHL